MIRRICITGYKSLTKIDLNLEPLTVLFGPNGAGKSNFLDALQLLSKIASARTLKEAFEPPYRGHPLESFTFGPAGIESLLNRDSASFTIEVDVELSKEVVNTINKQILEMRAVTRNGVPEPEGGEVDRTSTRQQEFVRERNLRYRITVEILPKSGILRVADEYLSALNNKGEPTGKRRPFLERVRSRLHLRMEGQSHPTYFDQHLDHSMLSKPLYPPHYPHLVAMRQELSSWYFFYFEPRERMRAPNPAKEVRHIGMMGEELASFLNTLKVLSPRQFVAVQKSLQKIIPTVTGIHVEVNSLGEVELKLQEGATLIPARVLSEGTLRILGLLALSGAKEPPALLGFEEPENGIHPRRVRMIAELLKTRASSGTTQVIVTSHSTTFLNLIDLNSLYLCRKEGVTTVISKQATTPLTKEHDITLDLDTEEVSSVSDRLLRGDFDA